MFGVLCFGFSVQGSEGKVRHLRLRRTKREGLGLGYVGIPKYPIIGYLGLGL